MNKLKIILINPPIFNLKEFDRNYNKIKGYSLYPPVQLATIAASALQKVKDIELEILDLNFIIMKYFNENEKSPLSPRDLMKTILIDKMNDFQPDLIGIAVTFSTTHDNAVAVANIIKKKNPTTKVVCGGNHPTFMYDNMLKQCSNIDYILTYEADNTFPLFLEYLKGKIEFKELKGLAWLDKATNKTKLAPYSPQKVDLDSIPIFDWNLVPIKEYQKYGKIDSSYRFSDPNLPSYVMQTSRGCVGSCTFCTVRSFFGKDVRAYSAKRVLQEIDYLYNDLGIKQLQILDDDFSFDKKRNLEICNGLIKRNYDLIWYISNGIRLGTLTNEVVHAMVDAKCRGFSIGVESGNDTTLAIVHKPLSIKMLYRKSEIFKKYPELYVIGNYMVGFPFETDEQLMNTYKVAEEVAFDWSRFSVFIPLPGTPFFQKINKKTQKNMNFNNLIAQPEYDTARKYKQQIEKQMQKTIEHKSKNLMDNLSKKENINKNHTHYQKKISEEVYIKNLEINFIRNINLNGKNINRAIQDFEGILNIIEKDHAIAH